MTLTANRKLRELDSAERALLARLLGSDANRFEADAELRLELRSAHGPSIEPRDAAPALAAIMARMEMRLRSISDAELDAALDEAQSSVRPAYRR